MNSVIENTFGHKLRVRVNAILIQNQAVLLLNHDGMIENEEFWSPPGGGVNFGEKIIDALHREVWEEIGLRIDEQEFISCYEYINPPLHAFEVFYKVKCENQNICLGTDPELSFENQILNKYKWHKLQDLNKIDQKNIHGIFHTQNTINNEIELLNIFKKNSVIQS